MDFEYRLQIADTMMEILALTSALGELMVRKGICTPAEIEEMTDAVKKNSPMAALVKRINEQQAELAKYVMDQDDDRTTCGLLSED